MNAKELIEKYEYELKLLRLQFGEILRTKVYEELLDYLKQLDEPQKVQVPQFVADLIKYAKEHDWDLEDTFQDIAGNDGSSDIYQWYYTNSDNMDKFARAWLDGYTVEEEKRYRVKIIGITDYNSYLNYRKAEKVWTIESKMEIDAIRTNHTRKELEEAGFGWVFECPGMEVEEVE